MDQDPGTVSRQQILAASLKVFAESGYDGARMDQIARTAGVNKSLIYYYFKSKREIFDVLVTSFYDELFRVLEPSFKPELFADSAVIENAFGEMFRYLESRSDLIRILFIETLKKGSEEMMLFQLVDRIFTAEVSLFDLVVTGQNFPLGSWHREQRIVTEFFTLIGPVLLYVILGEKWSIHFKTDKETLKNEFVTALKSTHLAHHRDEIKTQEGG